MKSRAVRLAISIVIFLLIAFLITLVIKPVYNSVTEKLQEIQVHYTELLEENIGIGIEYDSISPSVFTAVRINGIRVFDVESGYELLTIRKVTLHYSFYKILKRETSSAFTKLILNDVSIEYTDQKEFEYFRETFRNFRGYKEKKEKDQWISGTFIDGLENYLFMVPFDVQVNKLNFHFLRKNRDYRVDLKSLSLHKQEDNSYISIKSKGQTKFGFKFTRGRHIGFNFSLDGKIMNGLDGTSIITNLTDFEDCDFSISQTEILFRYSDMKVMAISNTLKADYKIYGSLDLYGGVLDLHLDTSEKKPDSLVHVRGMKDWFYDVYDSDLSVGAVYNHNFLKHKFVWAIEGDIGLSTRVLKDKENLNVSITGTGGEIDISYVHASGELFKGSLSGTYGLKTKEISAVLLTEYITLPTNGNRASFDLYVDPYNGGLMGFIPELTLGNQVFTGLQLSFIPKNKNYDFTFEMNDFSHSEYESPGIISIDGSYSGGQTPFVEAYINVDSIFGDSILNAVSFAIDKPGKKTLGNLAPSFSSYITSDEIYVSSDLRGFTFNVPYGIIANTLKERQFLIMSLDGSEQSLSVSNLSLLYGAIAASATLDIDYSLKDKQFFFNSQCVVNTIPYNFSGSFLGMKSLVVSGDYGTDMSLLIDDGVSGSIIIDSMPIKIKNYILSLSADTMLNYHKRSGYYDITVNRFGIEEVSGNIKFMPKIDLSGNISPDGFVISSLGYSDIESVLDGTGYVLWNVSEGIVDTVSLNLNVGSSVSGENIDFQVYMSNPEKQNLGIQSMLSSWYFSSQLNINKFAMGRLLSDQSTDDTLTCSVYALGTIDNPYVSVSVDSISLQLASLPLFAKGNIELIDGSLGIKDFYVNYTDKILFNNFKANIDLWSFTGDASADLQVKLIKKQLDAPMTFTLDSFSVSDDTWKGLSGVKIPEEFTLTADSPEMNGTLIGGAIPLHAMISKIPGAIMLSTDEVIGTSGFYLNDGSVNLTITPDKPFHLNLNGQISNRKIDLTLSDLFMDMSYFSYLVNSPFVSIYNGNINGDVRISGLFNDPSFDGSVVISSLEANFPDYIKEHLKSDDIIVSMEDDIFVINETVMHVKTVPLKMSGFVDMDRWSLDRAELSLRTSTQKGVPLDVKIPYLSVKGEACLDVMAAYYDKSIDVSGNVKIDGTDIIALDNLRKNSKSPSTSSSGSSLPVDVRINVNMITGQKVRTVLKPVISAIVVPGSEINFIMDTTSDMWNAKGDIALRGGEVSYLSRNFYIKEGRVVLDENQNSINPLITLKAETREKDSDGKSVTIVLSAQNQYLDTFRPVLSSIPAKSETEIMNILGQVVTGDSESFSNFLVAGVDYAAQVTVLQNLTNSLRELLNFDIFSLRSTILQQAIKNGLNMNENNSNNGSLSNLFDNTTVYIGKYLGSSVYADAQLRWVYNESADNLWGSTGALQFQPELGFELDAPFANIRWNFAPDIGNLQNSWIPATSITLSWSFTF